METPPPLPFPDRRTSVFSPASAIAGAIAITDAAFYRARAEEAKMEASRTSLARVRDKCLRAADAWTAMAERVEQTQRMRKMKQHAEAGT